MLMLPNSREQERSKVYKSLKEQHFNKYQRAEQCYCQEKAGKNHRREECAILIGHEEAEGNFFGGLAQFIILDEGLDGMVITMRFSPKCPESLQPFPMLLLWKLIRVIMEEEKIPPAVLGVCIPRIQPATHGYSIIVNQKEEHRYVMNDIMNTFLMGWPLLLELIHPLGNAMPMELRVTVRSSISEQLTHRVSKITDCDGGIHSQMHNEALSLRHR